MWQQKIFTCFKNNEVLEGNSMISPIARQNNNYNPSFTMKFGPKMQEIFDAESALGKLNKGVRETYNALKADESTDSLVVDIANNPKFPYSPNANITPRFFLNVSSSKLKEPNNSTTILGEEDEKIGLSFKSLIELISDELFPKFIMNKLLRHSKKLSKTQEKVQAEVQPIKIKQPAKQKLIEDEIKMPAQVLIDPKISYVGVGENFKNIFSYRRANELLKDQDIKAYNSIMSNPRYTGLSFDIVRSNVASKGNKPIKFSLIYKNNNIVYQYNDLKGNNMFEFSDILKILDSEEFLSNLAK